MRFLTSLITLGLLGGVSANVIKRSEVDPDFWNTQGKIYVTYNALGWATNTTGLNKDAIRGCINVNGAFVSDLSLCATFSTGTDGHLAGLEGSVGFPGSDSILYTDRAYFGDPGSGEAWLFTSQLYYLFRSDAPNDTPAPGVEAKLSIAIPYDAAHLNLLWKRV